jgi:hypothetical protein
MQKKHYPSVATPFSNPVYLRKQSIERRKFEKTRRIEEEPFGFV